MSRHPNPLAILMVSISFNLLANAQTSSGPPGFNDRPSSGVPNIIKIVVPIVFVVILILAIVGIYVRYKIAKAIIRRFDDREAPSLAAAFFGRRHATHPMGPGPGMHHGMGFGAHEKGHGGGMMPGVPPPTYAGETTTGGAAGGHASTNY
ncbi:hypothetical protein BKA70DRAFT_1300568 [Coprinopsis sp. MPI-PUGE-AT-0042]|nr:hypothetical protein BKA70DRAFT_1300568 [Coprinopsis sp. MPI-PUGE-AT-0042]